MRNFKILEVHLYILKLNHVLTKLSNNELKLDNNRARPDSFATLITANVTLGMRKQ